MTKAFNINYAEVINIKNAISILEYYLPEENKFEHMRNVLWNKINAGRTSLHLDTLYKYIAYVLTYRNRSKQEIFLMDVFPEIELLLSSLTQEDLKVLLEDVVFYRDKDWDLYSMEDVFHWVNQGLSVKGEIGKRVFRKWGVK